MVVVEIGLTHLTSPLDHPLPGDPPTHLVLPSLYGLSAYLPACTSTHPLALLIYPPPPLHPYTVATMFTWDWKTAQPFWIALKLHLSLGDEIQCFKALIMIHKVVRDGHRCVLPFFSPPHGVVPRLSWIS